MTKLATCRAALALGLFAIPTAAQEIGSAEPTAAQVAELRANLEASWTAVRSGQLPEDEIQQGWAFGVIMMQEIVVNQAQALLDGREPTDSLVITERVMGEWIALSPDSAAPHLALARSRHAGDEIGLGDAVLAIAARFPDDPLAIGEAVQILERRDDPAAAAALVERLLARGPRLSKGLRWATNWLRENRQGDRARELELGWLASHPGDADVLAGHLRQAVPPADERRRLVHMALAADDVRALPSLCGELRQEVDLAVVCWQRAGELAKTDEQRSEAAKALAMLTTSPDDPAAIKAQIANLPGAEAVGVVLRQISGLADKAAKCERVVELLNLLDKARLEAHFGAVASSLRGCLRAGPAVALFLDLVEAAEPGQVLRAIQPAALPRSVRRGEPPFPPEAVARVLERRLARDPDPDLHRSLVALWDMVGDEALVIAAFGRWTASGGAGLETRDVLRLALALVDQEQIDEALEVLAESVARAGGSYGSPRHWEELVEEVAWVATPAQLERLSAILTSGPGGHVAILGRLVSARLALVQERDEEAKRAYLELLEGDGWLPKSAALEALQVVGARLLTDDGSASAEESAQLAARAAQACAHPSVLESRVPSRCAAELLHEAGFSSVALEIARQRLAGADPDPVELASYATIARGAGRDQDALWALERLLAVSPSDGQAWGALGELVAAAGDTTSLEQVWLRARQALGRSHPQITLSLARLEIDQGHPANAIPRLEELRATVPYVGNPAHLELRRAWAALGEPKPSIAELRAEAAAGQADAELQLGRRLLDDWDEAAIAEGQKLVENAAATGDTQAAWILGWHWLRLGEGGAARPWLERAIEGGKVCAGYGLALVELFGLDGEPSPERAAALLVPCAESGDGLPALSLGFLAAAGYGEPAGLAGLDRWNQTAAAAGSLGWMLAFRLDGARNEQLSEAREVAVRNLVARITKRAAAGEPAAQTVLAALHQDGTWVEQDSPQALALGRRAAAAGSRSATCLVGQILRAEPTLAAGEKWQTWYQRAADEGESFCPRWLALWLGENDLSDRGRILALLERSAELSNYWAQLNLAQLWDEGWYGFERNLEQATKWRRRLQAIDPESRGWLLAQGLD